MDFNEIPPDTEYTTSEVIELPEPILVPETISRMALKIQLLLKGVEIEDIDQFMIEESVEKETDFAEVVGQDSLTRFDNKKRKPNNNNRNRNNSNS
jgi:hypothetical protein